MPDRPTAAPAVNHLAAARRALAPRPRRVLSALVYGLGYSPSALAGDPDTVAVLRRVAEIAAAACPDRDDGTSVLDETRPLCGSAS